MEDVVTRPLWEPRHEWESRVKFVEDHVADYGLEKAINLSIVWANMKFLECNYPPGTEAMVAHYPLPSLDEIRSRRMKRKVDAKAPSSSKKTKMSFSEISALISSVHTQSSTKATPVQLQTIANEMCFCKDCLKLTGKESFSIKGKMILECYVSLQRNFKYEIIKSEDHRNEVWSLMVNGEVVLKPTSTESGLLEEFVKMLNNWQEANQKPACPLVANHQSGANSGFCPDSGFQSDSVSQYRSYSNAGYGNHQGYAGGYQQSQSTNKWRRGYQP